VHLIQEIGSYAGFAAVVGLAVLSALYFSHARDLKRLREWAGRAPERAAEAEAGGRASTIAASRVPAQPRATPGPASPVAAPGAQPRPAAPPAEAAPQQPKPQPEPAGVGAAAAAAPAAAAAAARTPAAASAAGAGAATAASSGGAPAAPAAAPADGGNSGGTGTGAKVLPPRPSPPPSPSFTRPGESRGLGNTAIMSSPLASRRQSRLPPPRYLALIVAGLLVLGAGATIGVLALTDTGSGTSTSSTAGNHRTGARHRHHAKKKKNFPPAIDPSTVTVAVLNGTSVPGLAAKVGGRIQSGGFKLGNVTNAAAGAQRTESVAMFKQGSNRQARAVARRLGISQIEPIDAQTSTLSGGATVIVVVGSDQISR